MPQDVLTRRAVVRTKHQVNPNLTQIIMTTFLENLYNAPLNLSDKDTRNIFQEEFKSLKDKDTFKGRKRVYRSFVEIIETYFESTRMMEALKISTKWNTVGETEEETGLLMIDGIIDIFKSNKASEEDIKIHYDLVW